MYDDPIRLFQRATSCSRQEYPATQKTALLTLSLPARLLQILWSPNRKSLPHGSLHISSTALRLAETGIYGGKGGKDC
jgi:hypothetical protein